jgi:hypothetical protein
MKRLAIAGVLALALVASSQQRASAWCKFSCSLGFNISYESSGFSYSSCCNLYSNPCPYGGPGFSGFGGFPAYGYNAVGAYPVYAAAPAAAPATSPTFTAPKPTPASGAPATGASSYAGTQPVNYSYYGQAGYGYGYGSYSPAPFQAPSYWYDR